MNSFSNSETNLSMTFAEQNIEYIIETFNVCCCHFSSTRSYIPLCVELTPSILAMLQSVVGVLMCLTQFSVIVFIDNCESRYPSILQF